MGKGLLFFLIPAIICSIGWYHIVHNEYPEITELRESVRPGYETVPAEYQVTVSPEWRWKNGGHKDVLVFLGYVFFAAAGYFIYRQDQNAVDKKGMRQGAKWVILIACWLAGTICIFGQYSFTYYKPKRYVKLLTKEQYENNKTDLDALFK